MLSNSCRYGLRAILYLASRQNDENVGIKQIASDLGLPTPFMAKILQQLAKHKILHSTKGPNGGFSLQKNPKKITLLEIVKIIDGEDIFTNCIIHDETCAGVRHSNKPCPIHEDYSKIQADLISLFQNRTIAQLVQRINASEKIFI
jgi:Rrf2 family transcriptional regulator, iron-sulfur cluster assembly transcription factor